MARPARPSRRTHSTIDKLPPSMQGEVLRMLVDDEWPEDFPGGPGEGKPRYEDVEAYLAAKGHRVSHSAIGRYALSVRTMARMRRASELAKRIMEDVKGEAIGASQKAVAEMITAQVIEAAAEDEIKPRDLEHLAKAVSAATQIALKADTYRQTQVAAKVQEAQKKITQFARKKKLDPETIRFIRENVYGITQ